jgi:5-methylcytosine-specific restriction endonuclease McrA
VEVHHVIEVEDGGTDAPDNLVAACKPCHQHYSAQRSQQRSVRAAWDWLRRPERHPGLTE